MMNDPQGTVSAIKPFIITLSPKLKDMSQVRNTCLMLCVWLLVSPVSIGGLQVSIPGLQSQCYSQHGHLNLGLLLRLHQRGASPHLCSDQLYKVQRLSYLEAFVYAIKDVNNRSDLLPNVTLGFLVLDTCANRVAAVSRSLYFIPEPGKGAYDTTQQVVENCVDGPPDMDIIGIVGPPSSGDAVLVGSLLSGFQIPLISPSATSDELSDKTRYEYFVRMVPPDKYQVEAMIDLLRHYNWTFTSLLYSQGEYGLNAAERFAKQAKLHDMCVSVDRMFISDLTSSDADDIYRLLLQNKKARAVVLFLDSSHQKALFDAAGRARQTGETFRFVWVGSDFLVGKDYGEELDGTFIMYHSFPPVPAFEEYYSKLTPWNSAGNPWMRAYWAKIHGCTWNTTGGNNPCENYTVYTGWEQHVDTYVAAYVDAVYAYAHALDGMIKMNCPEAFLNSTIISTCIDRPLLLSLLRNQTFLGSSGVVQFDNVGDAVPRFSIRQFMNNRTVKHVEVGRWEHQDQTTLTMEENLVDWTAFEEPPGLGSIPESICSEPCGLKQQIIPTDVLCCWTCGSCRGNEILTNNRTSCLTCPPLTWPDEATHTVCLHLYPDSVQPWDPVGVILLLTGILGVLGTVTVMVWYYRHGHEKLIKASSRELSTIIFVGMLLAYLTVLLLVVRPTDGSCVLIRVGFHVSVSLIYGPLMVRTLRIYRIFTGGKKGIRNQKLIGSKSQLVLTALLLVPQVVFVLITCIIAPPRAELRMPLEQQKLVELFCDFSVGGVLPALCYNMCLLGICAVLGFLTRRLPDNFSESWYIFISVSTTLVLWVVTVPALLTSLYANQRYVLVGTCLVMNAAMTLSCLFLPKVYAVYFVDEEAMKLRVVEATRVAPDGNGGGTTGGGNQENS